MNRMNRTRILRLLAGCLLTGLLAAGCADSGADDGGSGQGGAATTAPTTTPAPPTRSGGPVTVVGRVTEGVEPGCLLLAAEGGGSFLLVGGERAELQPGRRVAVTGQVDRSLLSTCQQGEPLVVASIAAAP
jgi:Protein of unknown function (DUF5818)